MQPIYVLIPELIIFFLLLYGCYTDIQKRKVSNRITGMIAITCVPLIYLNINNLTLVHFFIIGVWVLGYIIKAHGAADVKAMIPIVFTLDTWQLGFMFLGILLATCALVAVQKIRKYPGYPGVPLFVAILAGYFTAFL